MGRLAQALVSLLTYLVARRRKSDWQNLDSSNRNIGPILLVEGGAETAEERKWVVLENPSSMHKYYIGRIYNGQTEYRKVGAVQPGEIFAIRIGPGQTGLFFYDLTRRPTSAPRRVNPVLLTQQELEDQYPNVHRI